MVEILATGLLPPPIILCHKPWNLSRVRHTLELKHPNDWPVSRDSLPPRSLPPETLLRYRFSLRMICFRIDSPPGDYILNQRLRGETISSPVEIKSPRRRVYF